MDTISGNNSALLPRLYERDIDVLLQEELVFNSGLKAFLAQVLALDGTLIISQCHLSVSDDTGETDVVAPFSLGSRHGVLLIENKIDAAFQPRQPERYKERAKAFSSAHEGALVFCILVAPRQYADRSRTGLEHFDAVVSYEDIARVIEIDATPRSLYRAAVLVRAIEQARAAYTLVPCEEVSDLWTRIYSIASKEFPALGMVPPGAKGSQSKWLILKADLPARITLDWKITKGSMELSFWKGAIHVPSDKIDLSSLPLGAVRKVLGETVAICLPLAKPPTDWTSLSDELVRNAFGAAMELLNYYRLNRGLFVR